ncbi:unnamed protein product [Didymodactylos carnosus]|uniref:Peptidase C1A papain C-terminal domain-containing protein n=1 Tax=Didymodactylos carnosus TaxID=1234261 RepID=A0A814X447_9BILA|nr:unnamed protein product [Didymodactylos carnosus]CAF1211091.1 unnamed protein product [Didymodactylos carnosus]CAF3975066.1 unnamed protein product [Didymodactylos carnosus]CAF4014207.1 unnamed protein product [Didymodactylos carnosus]
MAFALLFNRRTREYYRLDGCRRSKCKPPKLGVVPFFSHISQYQLPSGVDLRPMLNQIEQNRTTGSSVGNALAAIYEYFYVRTHHQRKAFSRLFIYYNARRLEDECSTQDTLRHATESDSGADIQFSIASLVQFGCCDESLWPYENSWVNVKPLDKAYQGAKPYVVQECSRLSNDIIELKECLAQGYPFVIAIKIFNSFAANHHGFVPMPKINEKMSIYRHAVVCVGYIDEQNVFIIRNSHGEQWGAGGYGFLPYEYVADTELTKDLWTIKSITNMTRLNIHQGQATWIQSLSHSASQHRMARELINDKQDWDMVYKAQDGQEINTNRENFKYKLGRTPRIQSADVFRYSNLREEQNVPHHYRNHKVKQTSPSPARDNQHHSRRSSSSSYRRRTHRSRERQHRHRRHSRETPFVPDQQHRHRRHSRETPFVPDQQHRHRRHSRETPFVPGQQYRLQRHARETSFVPDQQRHLQRHSRETPFVPDQQRHLQRHSRETPFVPGQQSSFVPNQHSPFVPGQQPSFAPNQHSPFVPGPQPSFTPNQHSPFVPGQQPSFVPEQQPSFAPNQRSPFVPEQQPSFAPNQHSPFVPEQQPSFASGPPFGQIFEFQLESNMGTMSNMVPFQMDSTTFLTPTMNSPIMNNPFVGNQPSVGVFNNPFAPVFYTSF